MICWKWTLRWLSCGDVSEQQRQQSGKLFYVLCRGDVSEQQRQQSGKLVTTVRSILLPREYTRLKLVIFIGDFGYLHGLWDATTARCGRAQGEHRRLERRSLFRCRRITVKA